MRKGKLPPHIVLEDVKEVIWYIPSGFPTVLAVPMLTKKHYPDGYKGSVITKPQSWERFKSKNKVQ
ncbi:hypothetical protein [Prochlorococcus marinus]|uniref:hypothetical protein n=1 Tax=Prochlorococcus marinus TaxID=1219 RepID=UPI0039B0A97D